MQLCIFHDADYELLDPALSPLAQRYRNLIDRHARSAMMCFSRTSSTSLTVPKVQLDHIASLHCDKWLEGTSRHMDLYAHAIETPQLMQPPANTAGLQGLRIVKYKSFSGDASGMIGEALFAFVLTTHLGLSDAGFVHLGASKSTGVFPDFAIHEIPQALESAFKTHGIEGAALTQTHAIPAEVKAMAAPTPAIVRERLEKAVLQLRSFWRMRALRSSSGQLIERGASIVFLALRNPDRVSYDGVLLWMT